MFTPEEREIQQLSAQLIDVKDEVDRLSRELERAVNAWARMAREQSRCAFDQGPRDPVARSTALSTTSVIRAPRERFTLHVNR